MYLIIKLLYISDQSYIKKLNLYEKVTLFFLATVISTKYMYIICRRQTKGPNRYNKSDLSFKMMIKKCGLTKMNVYLLVGHKVHFIAFCVGKKSIF